MGQASEALERCPLTSPSLGHRRSRLNSAPCPGDFLAGRVESVELGDPLAAPQRHAVTCSPLGVR